MDINKFSVILGEVKGFVTQSSFCVTKKAWVWGIWPIKYQYTEFTSTLTVFDVNILTIHNKRVLNRLIREDFFYPAQVSEEGISWRTKEQMGSMQRFISVLTTSNLDIKFL